jgi:hypothetical protein
MRVFPDGAGGKSTRFLVSVEQDGPSLRVATFGRDEIEVDM